MSLNHAITSSTQRFISLSTNGRSSDFESENGGSNPSGEAKTIACWSNGKIHDSDSWDVGSTPTRAAKFTRIQRTVGVRG